MARRPLSAPARGTPLLVYIHGIGAQAPLDALKLRWDLALAGRPLDDASRMVRWSDLLRSEADLGAVGPRARAARPSSVGPTPSSVLKSVGLQGHPEALDFAQSLLSSLGLPPVQRGARAKVVPLPQWLRKPLSKVFLHAFVGDAAAYFFSPGLRQAIQQRLLDTLKAARGRPITLVAHSLGSVIAHEVLSQMAPQDVQLEAFITLGSPLGLQEVQDWLEPSELWVPRVVTRWINLADPLDPVCLDKRVTADFAPHPQAAQAPWCRDELIRNARNHIGWDFNPHAAEGYLAHPHARNVILQATKMDAMARFVMARDVAQRLASGPHQRHPVLIELLEPGYPALGETSAQVRARERDQPANLADRIARTAAALTELVGDKKAARIDPLRRYIGAHLTADELTQVAQRHQDLLVYAIWRSAPKHTQTDQRSHSALKADAARASFGASGAGVQWAVLDTGIQGDHPHFGDVPLTVYDCTQVGPPRLLHSDAQHDANPAGERRRQRSRQALQDADGHGTHVCGLIAGQSHASEPHRKPQPEAPLRGVASSAHLLVYKVIGTEGYAEDAWIIKAMDHIAETNAQRADGLAIHGVNLSLGGPFDPSVYGCGFSPVCSELRRLWRSGVLAVAAAGNEGLTSVTTPDGAVDLHTSMSIGDPANLEECIAVGAVHADKPHLFGVSSFSSRGPTADGRIKPDVVAPGERVLSCNARWRDQKESAYIMMSGTSMAAPHVSGLLAAFLSVRREYLGRPDEVKQLLLNTCVDLGRDRYHQGRGLPSLMAMLLAA